MDYINMTPEQLEELAKSSFSSNKPMNFGPFILGNSIDAMLCGILLMQGGSYASSSARDSRWLKAIVAFVVAMNLWATGFAWAWVWDLFVQNFGTYRTFFSVKYLSWDGVINTGTVFAVQGFFALRAWKILNRNRFFGAMILALMLAIAGSGLSLKVLYSRYPYTLYSDKMKVPTYICLGSMVTVDLAITTTILCHVLCWRGINQRSDRILTRLARVTFESQLPPTMGAIALLIVYSIKCDSFFMPPLIWVQPKLYGISLLHTLNTRASLAPPPITFGTTYTASAPARGIRGFSVTPVTPAAQATIVSRGTVVRIQPSWSSDLSQNELSKSRFTSSDDEHTIFTSEVIEISAFESPTSSSNIDVEAAACSSRFDDRETRC